MKLLLKKYLLIYIAAVAGIALAITAAFILGDLANKMKPDAQILFEVVDEKEKEYTLKLAAWSCVWDKNITKQDLVITEMRLGEPVRIGRVKYAEKSGNYIKQIFTYEHPSNRVIRMDGMVITAEGNGEIEAEYSIGLLCYGKPGKNILDTKQAEKVDKCPRERYSILFRLTPDRRIGNDLTARRHRYYTPDINDDMHNEEYKQLLSDVYPEIDTGDNEYYRYVEERALIVSMYDLNNTELLLAKAEVRVNIYTEWYYDFLNEYGVIESRFLGSERLNELGINVPDSYGYNEAVLYDYWQVEEW